MTHGFLFSLHSIFLYLVIKFYEKPSCKFSILLGVVGGLIALIRPTEILCFLVWLLWDINSMTLLKERCMFLLKNFKFLFFIGLLFIITWIPQMIYWHHLTGKLLFYAYKDEKLFYLQPKISKVLFSPRNGLIPYCPVLLLYIGALFMPFVKFKSRIGVFIFVVLNIYLVSCWWCWWYGGSFSARALIQIYPYLAIGFAVMLHHAFNYSNFFLKVIKYSLNTIVFILVLLHVKFWYQCKNGYVHYDSMTSKAYWFIFPKVLLNHEESTIYYSLLRTPDYDPKNRDKVQ